ncbi:MAG: homoserine dehydrogenase, partial [Lachnospiraceae bacterium]|nr:homoserine dehydrogenase [Lachnospiraceae bacterium]
MKIAIFGFGTVGSGVFDVINMNSDIIAKRAGKPIEVKYVLDLRDFPGNPVEKVLVHDVNTILDDPEVKIIAEVMGGINPALDYTKRALMLGKSVCTSNKELVAAHGAELIKIAKEHNCDYYFEASVGGGIPIIRSLCDCLVGDDILEIKGIVNGTTNYILTRMGEDGLAFDTALKEAQENG